MVLPDIALLPNGREVCTAHNTAVGSSEQGWCSGFGDHGKSGCATIRALLSDLLCQGGAWFIHCPNLLCVSRTLETCTLCLHMVVEFQSDLASNMAVAV